MYPEYLEHYGVKGMKWRHRKNWNNNKNNQAAIKSYYDQLAKQYYSKNIFVRGDPHSETYKNDKGDIIVKSKLQRWIEKNAWNHAQDKANRSKSQYRRDDGTIVIRSKGQNWLDKFLKKRKKKNNSK